MSLEPVVRHCAPTLAGIKVGSLFSYRYHCEKQLRQSLAQQNQLLNHKGIYFVILRCGQGLALIYVYRKKQLEQELERPEVQAFLLEHGYQGFQLEAALAELQQHLNNEVFPHEIGVFLGYPISDIRGFIQHKGANYICVGCWKVYHNEHQAKKTFARYKLCTRVYTRRFAEGIDIAQLTVAG